MTTLLPNRKRSVYYNRFEGALARCSIYDFSQHKIISDESVINGGTYELVVYKGMYILDEVITSQTPNSDSLVDLSRELESLKAKVDLIDPKAFPRFYVWKSNRIDESIYNPLVFNEIEYNDGDMYSAQTGKATIKDNGMYIFSANLYKNPDSGNVAFYLIINENGFSKSLA